MNRRSAISMGLVLAGSAMFWHAQNASGQSGWTTLFDGSNVNNFEPIGNANWRMLEGGILQADVGSGFLVTKQEYGDFQLRAEFWVDATANSGIFIRATDPKRVTGQNAYEVNIFDSRPGPELRHRGDRQCGQGVADAQGRQPVEHLRHHGQGR